MKYKAYAKINLRLNVLGKNEYNYHNLSMLNAKVSLYDEIEFFESSFNKVEYSLDELNNLDNDLCLNVLNEISEKYNIDKKYNIYIKKNIPLGAGLGGGSSDVACIINALDELHNLKLSLSDKINLSLKYGADVPYCLISDIALVEGIGEKITKLNVRLNESVLVVYPNIFVSTKEVFSNVSSYNEGLTKDELEKYIYNKEYNKMLVNDLEEPSFKLNNELKEIKQALSCLGKVVMSGSGSTMLVLNYNKDDINKIKELYPDFLIEETYII